MRVLFLTQYFFPETGATSNRIYSLAEYVQKLGNEVLVVAEKPNHPEGVILKEYRRGAFVRRKYGPLDVLYCWVFTRRTKNTLIRLAFYGSFMISAVIGILLAARRFDVVIASSPPLFVGPAGWLAARLTGARFILDVRDLWPDVAVALGALRNPIIVRLARRLERFLYYRADGITAVTESFCSYIRHQVRGSRRVERVMNGTMPEIFNTDETRGDIRDRLGVQAQFVVLFSGNLGLAQGLDHVVEAATILCASHSDVVFLFLGNGPTKERLRAVVTERGLQNVRFLSRTTLNCAAEYMTAADALLVPLGNHPIYRKFIPSKLFDCMATGSPVLLSVDGEARSILETADAGIYYPAEDAEGLANSVLKLKANPDRSAEMGLNGRRFALVHCSREEQAKIMTKFIEYIVLSDREQTNACA